MTLVNGNLGCVRRVRGPAFGLRVSFVGRLVVVGCWAVAAVSWPAGLSAQTSSAPASGNVDEIVAGLKAKPAEYLPKARALFEEWTKSRPDNVSIKGFQQRLESLKTLQTDMLEYLKKGSGSAVNELVSAVAGGETTPDVPSKTPAPGSLPAAEQIYRAKLQDFLYPIDTSGITADERSFLGAYYHAEVIAAVQNIMHQGQALAVSAQQADELGNYMLILPLLHSPGKFDPALLAELPGWLLDRQRLANLSDFCLLRAARLDAAVEIGCLKTTNGTSNPVRYAFFVAAADKCKAAKRPDLVVQCLKAAIQTLEADDPLVVKHRFTICETWATGRNYALAASEAGDMAREYADTNDGAKAIFDRIRYLDTQNDPKAVLNEIDDALANERCQPYEAELMFIKWRSLRKVGKGPEAGRVLTTFVKKFPENPHVADMYYAVAVDCLSAQRYEEAQVVLKALLERFPNSDVARRAADLHKKLETVTRSQSKPAS